MNRHLRILLLDANRYHALLVERELSACLPASVVSVFHSRDAAVDELTSNPYDATIIDDTTVGGIDDTFAELIRSKNENLIILAMSSERDVEPDWVRRFLHVRWLPKDGKFDRLVSGIIGELIDARVSSADELLPASDSTVLADADLINIAASTLSHEINNPLMTILGETELLLQRADQNDSSLLQKIRVIRRSAFRIRSAMTRLAGLSEATVKRTDSGVMVDTGRS